MEFEYSESDAIADLEVLVPIIKDNGGEWKGTPTKGEIKGYHMGFFYHLLYNVEPTKLKIDIIAKPIIFSCELIERLIKQAISKSLISFPALGDASGRVYIDQSSAPIPEEYLFSPQQQQQQQAGTLDFDVPRYIDGQLGNGIDYNTGIDPRIVAPSVKNTGTELWKAVLADWLDPTSPPHTRTKCISYGHSDFPPAKWCTGYKTQFRYLYNRFTVSIYVKNQNDAKKALDECLKTSAIAAALVAVSGGGAAAIATFERVLSSCLALKLKSDFISLTGRVSSTRGPWE